jgi:SAM-dependent methyltransferase
MAKPLFECPTVHQWYELTGKYPELRRASSTLLKDYGVMRCSEFIEEQISLSSSTLRILEFGHGFNSLVLSKFQYRADMWGADRDQQLQYFNSKEWSDRFDKEMVSQCPRVTFKQCLVGEEIEGQELPKGTFDLIYSISVLEEMPLDAAGGIISAASQLLKPGGWLIGTYDLLLSNFQQLTTEYSNVQRKADLDIATPPQAFDWSQTLIENPASVMLWYMSGYPELQSQMFWGHHGTIFTSAQKRAKST